MNEINLIVDCNKNNDNKKRNWQKFSAAGNKRELSGYNLGVLLPDLTGS